MDQNRRQLLVRVSTWLALAVPALSVALSKSEPNLETLIPIVILLAAPLALRRTRGSVKLLIAIPLTILLIVTGSQLPSTIVVVGFVLAEIATQGRTRTIVWSAVVSILSIGLASVLVGETDSLRPLWLVHTIGIGLFLSLGIAIRERRALVEETKRSIEMAENAHRIELAEAIAQERLSISRELHNRLGHQLTVISLNTEVAKQHSKDSDEMRASLDIIGGFARQSLEEISSYLESLREKPKPTKSAGLLSRKFIRFKNLGLHVVTDAGELPESNQRHLLDFVDVAIEELLMNALKYGNGTAQYHHVLEGGSLNITLTNGFSIGTKAPSSGGYGLKDIRDQVSQLDGEFGYAVNGNEFKVELKLRGWS
jgi:signal transduction histidine kinase